MKKPSIGLAIEGLPFIFMCSFSALIFSLVGWWVMGFIFLVTTWIAGHFFRDPERVTPTGDGLAVSPADGKIVSILEKADPLTGQIRVCISVFMSLFDVHVNRMPVTAKISAIAYFPGKFFNASLDKASKYNERCAYFIESNDGSFVIVQIAGLVAQRIVCRVDEDDELKRGDRFGMIKLGSRVELYIPENYHPSVSVGQKVLAGQSIIAQRKVIC